MSLEDVTNIHSIFLWQFRQQGGNVCRTMAVCIKTSLVLNIEVILDNFMQWGTLALRMLWLTLFVAYMRNSSATVLPKMQECYHSLQTLCQSGSSMMLKWHLHRLYLSERRLWVKFAFLCCLYLHDFHDLRIRPVNIHFTPGSADKLFIIIVGVHCNLQHLLLSKTNYLIDIWS